MSTAGLPAPAAPAPHGDALQQHKYRKLVRQHIDRLLENLFTEVTGLHFHVSWAPAPAHEWEARTLPTGCSVCCGISGLPLLPDCQACGAKQLARTLRTEGDGHYFTCRLGVRNYWVPIRVRGETVGIAYLQALDPAAARRPDRKQPARVVLHRTHRVDAKVMDRPEFARAARLLRLIIQHVQTSSLADLQQEDLGKFQTVLRVFENAQTRLRGKINGVLPALRKTSPAPQPQSHSERIVRAVLDRIQQDHAQPLTLRKCAGDLRVNAAYLSHLFSRAVGLPFKTYLTRVRLEKAQELLGDPGNNIFEVASAVGYASANRFRIAFKNVTGISPRLWRETLQMNPPPPPSTLLPPQHGRLRSI